MPMHYLHIYKRMCSYTHTYIYIYTPNHEDGQRCLKQSILLVFLYRPPPLLSKYVLIIFFKCFVAKVFKCPGSLYLLRCRLNNVLFRSVAVIVLCCPGPLFHKCFIAHVGYCLSSLLLSFVVPQSFVVRVGCSQSALWSTFIVSQGLCC